VLGKAKKNVTLIGVSTNIRNKHLPNASKEGQSMSNLWWRKWNSKDYFCFQQSAAYHAYPIFIFILIIHLSEGQGGKPGNVQRQQWSFANQESNGDKNTSNPIFTKLTTTQQHCVEISYTKFKPNQSRNISTNINLFTSLSMTHSANFYETHAYSTTSWRTFTTNFMKIRNGLVADISPRMKGGTHAVYT